MTISISAIMTTRTATPAQPLEALIELKVPGRVETTEQKMINDIPLPMPRWVMASPIHMRMALPAVRVVTMSATRMKLKLGTRSRLAV